MNRLFAGQYRAVVLLTVDTIGQGDCKAVADHVRANILTRQDRVHAGHGKRFGFVDRRDFAMRKRTSHESCVHHSVHVNVIDKTRFAAEQIWILKAVRASPKRLVGHVSSVRMRFAASSVAEMML
jgi:hypothetical protein